MGPKYFKLVTFQATGTSWISASVTCLDQREEPHVPKKRYLVITLPEHKSIRKMQGQPSRVIIFDIYGTLFKLDKPKHLLRELFGASPDTYLLWYSNSMCTAQSLALQNEFIPFGNILEKELKLTIRVKTYISINLCKNSGAPSFKPNAPEVQNQTKLIIDSFKELDLKMGTVEALQIFKDKNYRMACLANGRYENFHICLDCLQSSEEWAVTVLKRSGIEHYFQNIICCDTLRAYKPCPIIYEKLCEIPGDEKWIISSVLYDFIGAKKYGFKTVFCSDLEGMPDVIPPPDLEVKNLKDAAEIITHK